MSEKHEQHDEHQHHAADQNVGDRLHRRMNKCRPIIERVDGDSRWQFSFVEFLHLLSNSLENG